MKVFILSTYENDTYSYSGISESECFIHLSKNGAIEHAEKLKLSIVNYCVDPDKQATIEEMEVLP